MGSVSSPNKGSALGDEDTSPDTSGKNGRKPTISRVNRACNNCRRMKMRCVGGEEPPCRRCKHAGLDCVLERPGKSEPVGDERLSVLEHQVSSISSTLSDLVKVLQTSLPSMKPPRPPPLQHYQLMDWGPLVPGQPDVADRVGSTSMGPPPKRHPSPSLPPSRAVSVGPDDVLGADISRPLAAMSNMAGLVEAAMEKSREEDKARAAKRTYSPPPSGPSVVESPHESFRPSKRHKQEPKVHVHAFPDAVAEGLVSEKEGKEMMRIFYEGCFDFLPCFDPSIDTWESLRLRSPFSITTIIMIGARVRDGGGPPSDVQLACRSHAQKFASGTLFASVLRIEAVQAMALLATFTDQGWLPGGHAVRMGLDMGLDQAFGHLLRNGMGSGKTREQLAGEQGWVVQARVWFCLYLFEHQMAYGNGRPAILREDQSIRECRKFLDHPLSIPSDARLVSMVETTALRVPLHNLVITSPETLTPELILPCLRQANQDFEESEKYWLCTYMQRDSADSFLYESLAIQRQYSALFSNSQLLRDVRNPEDVYKLEPEAQTLAIQSIRNAERCVDICLRNEQYRRRLRYAVHYTHVCAAFAASFLLRITSLIPEAIDFDKTIRDVKELADLLSEIPAPRYGRSLKLLLRRAKRRHPEPTLPLFPTLSPIESSHLDAMFQDAMPLFLNEQSLGAPALDAPYAGIEDFFLPLDLDKQLQSLTETPETAASGPWW